MAQFDVYRNRDTATRRRVPYLLDVQSDLLEDLGTRVVIPLAAPSPAGVAAIGRLMPVFDIEGATVTLVTAQLAGVSRAVLGRHVGSLAASRREIVAALDVLISGV